MYNSGTKRIGCSATFFSKFDTFYGEVTVLEIVREHVKVNILNAHEDENVNITSCRK